MINIGICDDEKEHQNMLREMVSKSIFQFDDIKYSLFNSGEQVIEEIKNRHFNCELLLLDINMPGKNGLEIAEYIRKKQVDVDIIFVTVSAEYVFEGYTYRAFSYLLKPLNYKRLSDELKRYVKLKNECSKCLHVGINGKKVQIFLDRVKYFMASGRKIVAYQNNGNEKISFYAKLVDLQEILQKSDFLRCHQSYLVNTKYVQSYSRTEIDIDGEAIPVSRRYIECVRSYFRNLEV